MDRIPRNCFGESSYDAREEKHRVLELFEKFRTFRPYLKKRLRNIHKDGRQRQLRDEVEDIEYYLTVMSDMAADENHGADTLQGFLDRIHEMIRKNSTEDDNNDLDDSPDDHEDDIDADKPPGSTPCSREDTNSEYSTAPSHRINHVLKQEGLDSKDFSFFEVIEENLSKGSKSSSSSRSKDWDQGTSNDMTFSRRDSSQNIYPITDSHYNQPFDNSTSRGIGRGIINNNLQQRNWAIDDPIPNGGGVVIVRGRGLGAYPSKRNDGHEMAIGRQPGVGYQFKNQQGQETFNLEKLTFDQKRSSGYSQNINYDLVQEQEDYNNYKHNYNYNYDDYYQRNQHHIDGQGQPGFIRHMCPKNSAMGYQSMTNPRIIHAGYRNPTYVAGQRSPRPGFFPNPHYRYENTGQQFQQTIPMENEVCYYPDDDYDNRSGFNDDMDFANKVSLSPSSGSTKSAVKLPVYKGRNRIPDEMAPLDPRGNRMRQERAHETSQSQEQRLNIKRGTSVTSSFHEEPKSKIPNYISGNRRNIPSGNPSLDEIRDRVRASLPPSKTQAGKLSKVQELRKHVENYGLYPLGKQADIKNRSGSQIPPLIPLPTESETKRKRKKRKSQPQAQTDVSPTKNDQNFPSQKKGQRWKLRGTSTEKKQSKSPNKKTSGCETAKKRGRPTGCANKSKRIMFSSESEDKLISERPIGSPSLSGLSPEHKINKISKSTKISETRRVLFSSESDDNSFPELFQLSPSSDTESVAPNMARSASHTSAADESESDDTGFDEDRKRLVIEVSKLVKQYILDSVDKEKANAILKDKNKISKVTKRLKRQARENSTDGDTFDEEVGIHGSRSIKRKKSAKRTSSLERLRDALINNEFESNIPLGPVKYSDSMSSATAASGSRRKSSVQGLKLKPKKKRRGPLTRAQASIKTAHKNLKKDKEQATSSEATKKVVIGRNNGVTNLGLGRIKIEADGLLPCPKIEPDDVNEFYDDGQVEFEYLQNHSDVAKDCGAEIESANHPIIIDLPPSLLLGEEEEDGEDIMKIEIDTEKDDDIFDQDDYLPYKGEVETHENVDQLLDCGEQDRVQIEEEAADYDTLNSEQQINESEDPTGNAETQCQPVDQIEDALYEAEKQCPPIDGFVAARESVNDINLTNVEIEDLMHEAEMQHPPVDGISIAKELENCVDVTDVLMPEPDINDNEDHGDWAFVPLISSVSSVLTLASDSMIKKETEEGSLDKVKEEPEDFVVSKVKTETKDPFIGKVKIEHEDPPSKSVKIEPGDWVKKEPKYESMNIESAPSSCEYPSPE